ncbi:hypothetical protein ScPMuIL_012991 [Solemya velum]
MPLRILLRFLTQNEQLIQKLAESYPIRRAAQLTAFMFFRGKSLGQEGLKQLKEMESLQRVTSEATQRANSFKDTFSKEFKQEFQEVKRQLQNKKR